jgi:alkylation response protein AidB-like acyl-CoA dehydrogenase
MDLPGIEIRPLIEMTGQQSFNEVFFNDVRLPAHNLIGEENDGWNLAKITLANERVALSREGALWGRGPTAQT